MYDNRQQSIKVIDPRGIDSSGKKSIFGDARYDLAKLYHSVVGLYDLIIAGHYVLEGDDIVFQLTDDQVRVQSIFKDCFFADNPELEKEILAINVQLFLSMLPLHSDVPERQKAMLVNARRMYSLLLEFDR